MIKLCQFFAWDHLLCVTTPNTRDKCLLITCCLAPHGIVFLHVCWLFAHHGTGRHDCLPGSIICLQGKVVSSWEASLQSIEMACAVNQCALVNDTIFVVVSLGDFLWVKFHWRFLPWPMVDWIEIYHSNLLQNILMEIWHRHSFGQTISQHHHKWIYESNFQFPKSRVSTTIFHSTETVECNKPTSIDLLCNCCSFQKRSHQKGSVEKPCN